MLAEHVPPLSRGELPKRGMADRRFSRGDGSVRSTYFGYIEPLETNVAISRTIEWEQANPPNGTTLPQFDYSAEDAAVKS